MSKKAKKVVGMDIDEKNIKSIKPIVPEKLAEILKQHNIYIAASRNDPCSNSLIEASSCGLPAVALNDGGHPELVGRGEEIFDKKEEILEKIEKIVNNYYLYQQQIPKFSIKQVAQKYYEFTKRIYDNFQKGEYKPKEIRFSTKIRFYKLKATILKWKAANKSKNILCKR